MKSPTQQTRTPVPKLNPEQTITSTDEAVGKQMYMYTRSIGLGIGRSGNVELTVTTDLDSALQFASPNTPILKFTPEAVETEIVKSEVKTVVEKRVVKE